jgi:hypothetical protein
VRAAPQVSEGEALTRHRGGYPKPRLKKL